MSSKRNAFMINLLLFLSTVLFANSDFKSVEKQVIEYKLDNGLTLLILPRNEAPVVSSVIIAKVGGGEETEEYYGIAHILEHMAFKGTRKIGTKNFLEEKKAMAIEDSIFELILEEKAKGSKIDSVRFKELQSEFEIAKEKTKEFIISNQFGEIVNKEGGIGLNACTSCDHTFYMCSVPSNKLELLMCLESDRFLSPVLREFYTEVQGPIAEERRMRLDNPMGKLFEEFLITAFPEEHPYGHPIIGYMDDILTTTRDEASKFFSKYYIPSNLIIGIVGDVNPDEVKKLAEIYWGRLPKKESPQSRETPKIAYKGEKRIELELPGQPMLIIGYHRPNLKNPNDLVYDVIAQCLGIGRTSRLYKKLVTEKKLAIQAGCSPSMPGNKYSNLFMCIAIPSAGHTAKECEETIYEEIERLKKEFVSEKELDKAKAIVKAAFIEGLEKNSDTAFILAYLEASHGDWHYLFTYLNRLEKITPQDVQRVAKEIFTKDNRVVGSIVTSNVKK